MTLTKCRHSIEMTKTISKYVNSIKHFKLSSCKNIIEIGVQLVVLWQPVHYLLYHNFSPAAAVLGSIVLTLISQMDNGSDD